MGAVVIHVIEFHLGLGINGTLGQRLAAAMYMVQHCPLRVWIALGAGLAILAFAAGTVKVRRDLRLLRRLRGSGDRHGSNGVNLQREPVDRRRLVGFCLGISAIQWLVFTLAMHAMPMTYVMKMQGSWMVMAMSPPVPVLPLCLIVGLIGGVILGLCERRIRAIASLVAALMRVLFEEPASTANLPASVERPSLTQILGPALFSRPPPAWLPS